MKIEYNKLIRDRIPEIISRADKVMGALNRLKALFCRH